jgi:PKD repeat protein
MIDINSIKMKIISAIILLTIANFGFAQCDTTISNINFATDNIRLYPAGLGSSGEVTFIAGHNNYNDLGKYDYYNYGGTNTHILGSYFGFGYADASNATNTFNVVVRDGTGGVPGGVLATVPMTYQEVADSIAGGDSVMYVPFNNLLMPASNEFFVGIEFSYSDDTIALLTNTIGETTPNTGWEQWGDLTFHPYSDPGGWNFDLAHFIIPVLGLGPLPTASFTQSSPSLCTGGPVSFTNTSTSAINYLWNFPGGTPSTSTATNPTVTYNAIGAYDVTLIAINNCFSDTTTVTNSVTINNNSTPSTTGTDTTTYMVDDIAFANLSPVIYFEAIDTLTAQSGCDSLLIHHTRYLFSDTYCTDTTFVQDTAFVTIYDTTVVFDTTFVTIYDTTEVFDTTFVTIYDTTEVFDTTFVTIYDTITYYDTVLVSVTDTLIIDVSLTGVAPPNNINTMKVYPNPANDVVIIDNGDYSIMSNYTLKILNTLGQEVFNSFINIPQFQIPVSVLGAVGLYYIQVFDDNNSLLETKKLMLN